MRRTSILILVLLLQVTCLLGQSQRLLVPALSNVAADNTGVIRIEAAYCLDPVRSWPGSGTPLAYVYYGQKETWVTLKRNNISSTLTLQEGISKGYVQVQSGGNSLLVAPADEHTRLVKLKTNGFAAGAQDEVFDFESRIRNIIPANPDMNKWKSYQAKLHDAIVKDYKKNGKDILPEFARNKVETKWGLIKRSGNWEVTTTAEKIFIKESRFTQQGDGRPFRSLLSDLFNDEDIFDLSVCINIGPDGLSLKASIAASYKGLIPVNIEYSSDNSFTVSTTLAESQLNTPGSLPADVSIS